MNSIKIKKISITGLDTDAIVNAANMIYLYHQNKGGHIYDRSNFRRYDRRTV